MNNQDWIAHVRRFYAMTPGQQNEEWQKMSPEQREAFEAARERVAQAAEAKQNLKTAARWTVGLFVLLVVGLALYVRGEANKVTAPERYEPPSNLGPVVGDDPPPTYKPLPPPEPTVGLDLEVTVCSTSYGYTKTEGYVENTGDVTVNFVTVETRWQDASGQVVDTGWTYAVGSEHLRPGDRSTFTDSTRHASARRCAASLQDYKRVGR